MALYEERFQKEMTRLRDEVFRLGEMTEEALQNATQAVLLKDEALANQVIIGDQRINRQHKAVHRLVLAFIVKHSPSAGHLRQVISVLELISELERIGDYAVTIGREAINISQPITGPIRTEMEQMVEESRTMLHQAMTAFRDGDAGLARGTEIIADQVERDLDRAFEHLVELGDKCQGRSKDLLDLSSIFYMLERVSDRSKNICEETLFVVTGEEKPEKIHKILFIDQDGGVLAPMALAIAQKMHPASIKGFCAGNEPAAQLDSAMASFMKAHGHDLTHIAAQGVERLDLHAIRVIVSLNAPVRSLIPAIPFHAAYFEWNVGPLPGEGGDASKRFEEIHRALAQNISQLMETLRGEAEGG
ncbi:MAG: phosphate signaling complex protein PhoU [Magnetococcales bacterium]|nr:phosphate signaling complex protein PhoU [Magnetococcales bacterium]